MPNKSGRVFTKLHSGMHVISDAICILCGAIGTGWVDLNWPQTNGVIKRRIIICDCCQRSLDDSISVHINVNYGDK